MKYLINNKIEFNPADGSLLFRESEDIIKLPLPANRLLEEFLTSGGQELTREYLLEHVWDRHGLQASGNNLNQYVSILRRNFTLLDCPELIITLPKVGFKLNPAVSIVPVTEDKPQAASQQRDEVQPAETHPHWKRATLGLLLLLSVGVLLWGVRAWLSPDNAITELRDPVSHCEIIYLKDVAEEGRAKIIEEVTAEMKKYNLQCKQDQVIFYNIENASLSRSSTRTLFALCSRGEKKEIVSCENLYTYKWPNR